MMNKQPMIHWVEASQPYSAMWRSESGLPPPKRVVITDDRISADAAYRLITQGTALLWRGDFQNARQLLQALKRRVTRHPRQTQKPAASLTEAFHLHRQTQTQRAHILGRLLLPFNAHHHIPLRRAPNVQVACNEVYGSSQAPYIMSLRELLGVIGAHEWRKQGVVVPALAGRIFPHYGVFPPTRNEYIDLVAQTALPTKIRAFDIGTGSGVLAAVLAKRGVAHVIATDHNERAVICARANIEQLGLTRQVEVIKTHLFPEDRAGLIVCNPPWLPAQPSSSLEYAVYDPHNQMLYGFLNGLAAHLEPSGEGWLILSDFAEHLGLRTRAQLLEKIATAGLQVIGKIDVFPQHSRAQDPEDPLYQARSAEVTSLWRLAAQ